MTEKEYYTIEEVGKTLGRNRATVYNRMNLLGIKAHKFKMDRKTYIAAKDVEQLRNIFEKPWLAGEKETAKPDEAVA
jgi:hypothetical protein